MIVFSFLKVQNQSDIRKLFSLPVDIEKEEMDRELIERNNDKTLNVNKLIIL